MFLWAVPVLSYLALMALVSVIVLRWIMQPALITTMQATQWLVALWLVIGFYINVADEWIDVPGRIDCASAIVLVFAVIGALRLVWYICCSSDEHRHRFNLSDPTLAGFPLLSWLAMAIMFATTSQFIYTNYIPYNDGAVYFDAYGWPWTYLVSADGDSNFYNDIHLMNGWTIGERRYLPLAANTAVLGCMSVATLVATTALARIKGIRPSFSLARVFAVVSILALPLALEGGEARPVNWPNWYVHFVVSLGLAAVGYLVLRLIRWILQVLNAPDASIELAIAEDVDL
jgi:hypothetical protein